MNRSIAKILSSAIQNRQFSRVSQQFRLHDPPVKIIADEEEKDREFFTEDSILPFGIRTEAEAKTFSRELLPGERKLLFDALRKITADQYNEHKKVVDVTIDHEDLIRVWYINFMPMFVYGALDEAFLIIGGESINNVFSVYNGMSMLASAAVANIICNLFLQIPTSKVADFFGIQKPVLSVDQMNTADYRYASFSAKLCGLWCGLTLGLLPLFFIDDNYDNRPVRTMEYVDSMRREQNKVTWLRETDREMKPDELGDHF